MTTLDLFLLPVSFLKKNRAVNGFPLELSSRALLPDVGARRRSSALAPDQHRAWAPCTRWRTPSTSHIPCPTSVVCLPRTAEERTPRLADA